MTKLEFLWFAIAISGIVNGVGDNLIMSYCSGFFKGAKIGLHVGLIISILIRVFCFFSAYKLTKYFTKN